ncbi:MAG: hypothetical protein HUU03_13675 [Planctomycetaceae bacterium]|nr:hypothetical protein [Planctomycetaceae bacterium]
MPLIFVGAMYIAVTLFFVAPWIAKDVSHRNSIRLKATFVWLLSTTGVLALYLRARPDLQYFAEAVAANVVTAVAIAGSEYVIKRLWLSLRAKGTHTNNEVDHPPR